MSAKRLQVRRLGIFGGTFDPPHIGHLWIAMAAMDQLGLDEVVFVPAFLPPHKREGVSAPGPHRLAMTKLAAGRQRRFRVSNLELRRKGVSYTVDTLRHFRKSHPDADMWFIVGSDNLSQFHAWKEPKGILALATLAVYRRTGSRVSSAMLRRTGSVVIEGPALDVSATIVRAFRRKGSSVRFLVPDAVDSYIRRHRLYR